MGWITFSRATIRSPSCVSGDAVMDGKRIKAWDFVPVPNRPHAKSLPAKRRALRRQEKEAKQKLKDDEGKHSEHLQELARIDARWLAADSIQRQSWLDAMSEGSRMFAPKPGARPGYAFVKGYWRPRRKKLI